MKENKPTRLVVMCQNNSAASLPSLLFAFSLCRLAVTLFITGAALQGINQANGIMSTKKWVCGSALSRENCCFALQPINTWGVRPRKKSQLLEAVVSFIYLFWTKKWFIKSLWESYLAFPDPRCAHSAVFQLCEKGKISDTFSHRGNDMMVIFHPISRRNATTHRHTPSGGLTCHLRRHQTALNYTFHSFFSQCINEEGFRLFLKTYLEVEDFPVDLCQRLFRSFQNSEATQEDSASEIIQHALTQLSGSTLLCSGPLSIYAMAYLAYIHLSPHACEALFVQIW